MDQPIPQQPSEQSAKIEYDRLIAYFDKLLKITGGLLAIVVAAAAALLWQNISSFESQAQSSIKAAEESTTREMSEIRSTAEATAKAEAQKAIEAAFEKQNIQRMIEMAAQRKVDAAVEASVQKNLGGRIDAFRSLINEIGEISNHGAQLRLGYRSGLDYLLKTREESSDPTVRAYASSTIKLIAADYERGEAITMSAIFNDPNRFFYPAAPTPKLLMGVIRNPPEFMSAQITTWAFLDMKKRVSWDVPLFDVPAAEKWCAGHKPKCDE